MYTQCSNCHTVFQLSAEVLRAAGGQVRCGRCGEIFSALARLAEDATSFDNGESDFDMEERADSILESLVAEQLAQPLPQASDDGDFDGSEVAQLQVLDFTEEDLIDEPTENTEMEFSLSPDELDRIFIESKAAGVPAAATAPVSTAPVSEPVAVATPPEDEGPLPDIEVISDDRSLPLDTPRTTRASSWALWWGAAIVSTLLLVGQVVHRNREVLTAHGPLAPGLRWLYASLGTPIDAAPDLAVYQLRQWGVTGDPEAPGATLRMRATILNTSSLPQPFPLLRVTLANRYGARIGMRDFEPGEYMHKSVDRRFSPSEKVDVILNILDPGKDAEGFEIDVCLRGADKKINCANDTAPAQSSS